MDAPDHARPGHDARRHHDDNDKTTLAPTTTTFSTTTTTTPPPTTTTPPSTSAAGGPLLGSAAWGRGIGFCGDGIEGFGEVAPAAINAAGGNAPGSYVTSISWSNWGAPEAMGQGQSTYVSNPNAPLSDATQATFTVVAFDLGSCNGGPPRTRKSSGTSPVTGGPSTRATPPTPAPGPRKRRGQSPLSRSPSRCVAACVTNTDPLDVRRRRCRVRKVSPRTGARVSYSYRSSRPAMFAESGRRESNSRSQLEKPFKGDSLNCQNIQMAGHTRNQSTASLPCYAPFRVACCTKWVRIGLLHAVARRMLPPPGELCLRRIRALKPFSPPICAIFGQSSVVENT